MCFGNGSVGIANGRNRTGGSGTPHKPIFSTCLEPDLESAAILMKFTQDVCNDEKTSWPKKF